jgi:hypothetical protein
MLNPKCGLVFFPVRVNTVFNEDPLYRLEFDEFHFPSGTN